MLQAMIIAFVIMIICFIILVYYYMDKCNKLKSSIINLRNINNTNNEFISKLQEMISEESKQRVLYQQRALELEDSIKEGVGVTLRNEITKVECIFNVKELGVMLAGLPYLIRENFQSASGLKYYLSLIEKLEQNIILMNKANENLQQ
jgi:hypothetical protein